MTRFTNLAKKISAEPNVIADVRSSDKPPALTRRCWVAARAQMAGWLARARSRRELLALTDRDLADIRLSRAGAIEEASKPFWLA